MKMLNDIRESEYLRRNWSNYKKASYYVGDLPWDIVIETTLSVFKNEVGVLRPQKGV